MVSLPTLISKALVDCGYDLLQPEDDDWFIATISGSSVKVAVKAIGTNTLLSVPEHGVMERIGLPPATSPPLPDMISAGTAINPEQLYEALRLLHSLQTHPAATLSAEVEARLAAVPATERTREVRQRIGQDVYRGALIDLWQGRCALSGVELPSSMLRASHAKPWKDASDKERLDPFNGLLLAVHYDALFDKGLIAFGDEGELLISNLLKQEACKILNLDVSMRLHSILPGHRRYLEYHRTHIAKQGKIDNAYCKSE